MDQERQNTKEDPSTAPPRAGRPRGLSKGVRLLVLLMVFITIAIGAYGTVLYTIIKKSVTTATLLEELGGEAKKEQTYRAIRHALTETKATRDALEKYFVSENNVALFLQEMETVGRRAGVTTTIEHVTIERGGGSNPFLRVRFKVYGEFGSVYYLLALIETLPYNTALEQFVIRNTDGGFEDGKRVGPWEGAFMMDIKSFIAKDAA
ncbi:MAG: hypothetical protein HY455_00210 [Parcubacteria group bacterium]|nr:hypothetical protein [Parcubacteria group bacterium]